MQNKNTLRLGPKYLISVFLRRVLENFFVTFKISSFEFNKMVKLMQNKDAINLGTKLPY